MRRRTLLRSTAVAAAGGAVALAGCQGGGGGDDDDEFVPEEPNYQGWLNGVSNYRGTVDERGTDAVSVDVGVQGANGFYYYGPAAVAVSPGTEITWDWTGKGGTHNVISTSGAFTSGKLVDNADFTFSHTFKTPGVFRYFCSPHESLGMKGAVFVTLGQRGEST
jgi:halocyanin-like protein